MTRAGVSPRRAFFKQRIVELRAGCTGCHTSEKHAFVAKPGLFTSGSARGGRGLTSGAGAAQPAAPPYPA